MEKETTGKMDKETAEALISAMTEVKNLADVWVEGFPRDVELLRSYLNNCKSTAEFWHRYARERTRDKTLIAIAEDSLKSAELVEYLPERVENVVKSMQLISNLLGGIEIKIVDKQASE
jgi:hypothetical protein